MACERARRFEDQTQLFYQLVTGSRTNLEELDRLFAGGQNDQTRGYALAGALVHDIMQRHGSSAPREILMRVYRGIGFDAAFAESTGTTPLDAQSEFWQRQRIWTSWIPVLSSSTTLWLAVTILGILAIYMRRRRNRQIERQWAEEDAEDDTSNRQ
jgi:hypothetical protein